MDDDTITGAFIRVLDDNGNWTSKDIALCSDTELERIAEALPGDGWKWAKFLAVFIRDRSVR